MNSKITEKERIPRPEKVELVSELKSLFESSQGVVFTEYRGLDVESLKELRIALQSAGTSYKVYKNTLVRRAVAELNLGDTFAELLKGPVGLAFVEQDADYSETARKLAEYKKLHKAFLVKGGYSGGELMDELAYDVFSKLPARVVLYGQLASAIQAPLSGFAGVMSAVLQKFAGQLTALHQKLEAEAPASENAQEKVEQVTEEAKAEEPQAAEETQAASETQAADEPQAAPEESQ